VIELDRAYDPDVVAVQLNLLGSHDTPRVRTVLGGDAQTVRLATLLQMTLPGAPCVYYGDEVGLAGGNDPACRGAFPWDAGRWEPGLRETFRALVALRRSEPVLGSGPLTIAGTDGRAVAFVRGEGAGRHVVAVNAGETTVSLAIHLPDGAGSGAAKRLVPIGLPGLDDVPAADLTDGGATLQLVPRAGAVMRLE
jgi:neopullulanase